MGNFMGFAYGAYIQSQENHPHPLTEREIILQAQVDDEPQDPQEPARALHSLRESILRMITETGQKLEQEQESQA